MDDSNFYTDLLNIYMKHYNKFNNTNKNMFDGIEEGNNIETNDIMEELYDHIDDYMTMDDDYKKIYQAHEINLENFEQMFCLNMSDNTMYLCPIIIPLLIFLLENVNWLHEDWEIIPIKMS